MNRQQSNLTKLKTRENVNISTANEIIRSCRRFLEHIMIKLVNMVTVEK